MFVPVFFCILIQSSQFSCQSLRCCEPLIQGCLFENDWGTIPSMNKSGLKRDFHFDKCFWAQMLLKCLCQNFLIEMWTGNFRIADSHMQERNGLPGTPLSVSKKSLRGLPAGNCFRRDSKQALRSKMLEDKGTHPVWPCIQWEIFVFAK